LVPGEVPVGAVVVVVVVVVVVSVTGSSACATGEAASPATPASANTQAACALSARVRDDRVADWDVAAVGLMANGGIGRCSRRVKCLLVTLALVRRYRSAADA
jgi:hypothetical protein